MSYSNEQILNAISVAKCCMGDYTCKMLSKAINGQVYESYKLINIELSLLIFSLETDIIVGSKECITDSEKEKIVHRINKLCQCNCTEYSSSSSTSAGEHTVSSHTTISHTE